jgi:hypothetical protein
MITCITSSLPVKQMKYSKTHNEINCKDDHLMLCEKGMMLYLYLKMILCSPLLLLVINRKLKIYISVEHFL